MHNSPLVRWLASIRGCVCVCVCECARERNCERKEEGKVCNHLIQTYTQGISLLNLTVPFEPYLVSISRLSFGTKSRNLIPFVLKSLLSDGLLFVLSVTIFLLLTVFFEFDEKIESFFMDFWRSLSDITGFVCTE